MNSFSFWGVWGLEGNWFCERWPFSCGVLAACTVSIIMQLHLGHFLYLQTKCRPKPRIKKIQRTLRSLPKVSSLSFLSFLFPAITHHHHLHNSPHQKPRQKRQKEENHASSYDQHAFCLSLSHRLILCLTDNTKPHCRHRRLFSTIYAHQKSLLKPLICSAYQASRPWQLSTYLHT